MVCAEILSATLALSTRTPYVELPFHPTNVGYVLLHATAALVLFIDVPSGAVPLDASIIV
jgi:hypothetical protein